MSFNNFTIPTVDYKLPGISYTVDQAINENNTDLKTTEQKQAVKSNWFLKFLLYLFEFCIPIAGVGSIMYALTQLMSIDPSSILVNKNVSFVVNVLIGICGLVTVLAAMGPDAIKTTFNSYLLPYIKPS